MHVSQWQMVQRLHNWRKRLLRSYINRPCDLLQYRSSRGYRGQVGIHAKLLKTTGSSPGESEFFFQFRSWKTEIDFIIIILLIYVVNKYFDLIVEEGREC